VSIRRRQTRLSVFLLHLASASLPEAGVLFLPACAVDDEPHVRPHVLSKGLLVRPSSKY
jgi:hypothetical protein